MLRVGIVGLPNVGKSTLFNALTKQAAQASNFPFTTIEPNIGIVPVPDERLGKLAEISASEKIVPTSIEFVDIAGLVKDAHAGQGLGNKFLSHIREVDAIIQVVRFFPDPNVIHVDNQVDPLSDAGTINTELALADLETMEKVLQRMELEVKKQSKEARKRLPILRQLRDHLASGRPARELDIMMNEATLLTAKPMLYVANVSESQIRQGQTAAAEFAKQYSPVLPLSVKIEQELVELSDEERQVFLAEYGLTQTGLDRLIQAAYTLLNLITFLTTGPKETRAWTVRAGSTAPQAAGKIHSDFERGFIRAETVAYSDLIDAGSYAAARAAGKVRDEGKRYMVKDGDVMLFKFNV